MTVQNTTSRIEYDGNNSTVTPYPITFPFLLEPSYIKAYTTSDTGVVVQLVLETDYTVTYEADGLSGNLFTVAAVPVTSTITIYREVDETQLTEYHENDDFPAASHERALDKLTMIAQQQSRVIDTIADESLLVSGAPGSLDPVPFVANSVMGFGDTQPITYTPEELLTFLMISATVVSGSQPTAVFLNAAARAAATPGFSGQLGLQVDTRQVYIGTSLVAGGWTVYSGATKVYADSTARGAGVPDFVGQLAVQLDTNETYRASGTSAGNWTQTQASSSIPDDSIEQVKLTTGAKAWRTGVNGLSVVFTNTTTVTINVDEAVLTDGSGSFIRFASPSSIAVDLSASGVNGLDTGSKSANNWYHLYLMSNGSNLRGLFSLSETTPTLPVGYTYSQYITVWRNGSSNTLLSATVRDKTCAVGGSANALASFSYSGPSGTTASLASFVPPNAAKVRGYIWTADTANNVGFSVRSTNPGTSRSVGAGRSGSAVALATLVPFTWAQPFEVIVADSATPQSLVISTSTQTYNLVITGWDIK